MRKETYGGPWFGFFRNLKTAQKLLVGFALVTVLMVGVGLIGVDGLGSSHDRLEGMYRDHFVRTQVLAEVALEHKDGEANLEWVDDVAELEKETAEDDAELDEAWATYKAGDMTGRTELAAEYDAYLKSFRELRAAKVIPAMRSGDRRAAARAQDEVLAATDGADDLLDSLMDVEEAGAARSLDEAQSQYTVARTVIFGVLALAALLAIAFALGIARMIAHPLRRTVGVLQDLADGRLDQRLPVSGRDEVGEMGTALNAAMDRLAHTMGRIGEEASELTTSAEQLTAVSGRMADSAGESAKEAKQAAEAAGEVSMNVQTVVGGSAEMSASIKEIAHNATVATAVATQAVQMAETTNATIAKLDESSAEIGTVVKVINSLADQTNLLALNATIEAARAGESGKGFAVVANEVKELARETSTATADIASRIDAIQTNTSEAVAAISRITEIITQISQTQMTIEAAVEEQSATTNEIGRSVDRAADGSTRIAGGVAAVAQAADDATSDAQQAAEAAGDLSRMAADLNRLVGQFRY